MKKYKNYNQAVGKPTMSAALQSIQARGSTEEKVERLLQEINILNLERFLFSTDRKRQVAPGQELTFTDAEGRQYTIEFGKYGQPGETAYRAFHASAHHFLESARICADGTCHFRPLASISKRRLSMLSGRAWSGGKDDDDWHRSIMSLHTTRVSMQWFDRKSDTTQWQSFYLFSSAFFSAKGNQANKIDGAKGFESCVYGISPYILESYNSGYFRAYNLRRLMALRCTGQMIYKRLFLGFGYLQQKKGIQKFEKDYEAICKDWLNQPVRRYLSLINRHLGDHLDDLVRVGLLKRYSITPKVRGKGFKIAFWPGDGFYEDYSLYLETAAAQLPMRAPDITDDEPGKLVAYFHTKLGRTHGEFRPQELKQARELLKTHSLEEAEDLVDYALSEKSEKIIPQVFGFVLGYVPQWVAHKEERITERQRRQRKATCTLCDTAGFLHYLPAGARSGERLQLCPHDRVQVERWASGSGHIVPTLRAAEV